MIRAALMLTASLALPVAAMATLCLHGSEGRVEILGFCHGEDSGSEPPGGGIGGAALQHEQHPGTAFEAAGEAVIVPPPAAAAPMPPPRPDALSPARELPDRAGHARARGTDLLSPFLRL
jgi:hypothetical protein